MWHYYKGEEMYEREGVNTKAHTHTLSEEEASQSACSMESRKAVVPPSLTSVSVGGKHWQSSGGRWSLCITFKGTEYGVDAHWLRPSCMLDYKRTRFTVSIHYEASRR